MSLILVMVCAVLVAKLDRATNALRLGDADIQALRRGAARITVATERSVGHSRPPPVGVPLHEDEAKSGRDAGARAQLETLNWMKRQGMNVVGSPFGSNGADPVLSFSVAVELGLTRDEYNRLNTAIRQTKRWLDEAQMRRPVRGQAASC